MSHGHHRLIGSSLGEEPGPSRVIRVEPKRRNQPHLGYQGRLLGGGASELGLMVRVGVFRVKQSKQQQGHSGPKGQLVQRCGES